jgi:hypothetical protein
MKKKLSLFLALAMFVVNTYSQVTLYAGPEYSGASIKVFEGSISRMSATLIGNDRLSSMIISKGYMVTLFEHDNFVGYAETFNSSILNLSPQMAGRVSSLVVTRENGTGWVAPEVTGQAGWNNSNVIIYSECYYTGSSNTMLPTN